MLPALQEDDLLVCLFSRLMAVRCRFQKPCRTSRAKSYRSRRHRVFASSSSSKHQDVDSGRSLEMQTAAEVAVTVLQLASREAATTWIEHQMTASDVTDLELLLRLSCFVIFPVLITLLQHNWNDCKSNGRQHITHPSSVTLLRNWQHLRFLVLAVKKHSMANGRYGLISINSLQKSYRICNQINPFCNISQYEI